MTIRVEIVSQDRTVFEGDVDIVVVPGSDGEMGILPNHAPLLSTLRIGVIKVRRAGEEQQFIVTGGLIEVQPKIVTILADAAENVTEIDIARAEEAKRRAEQRLAEGGAADTESILALESALRRSTLRLEMAKRFGQTRQRSTQFPNTPSAE
jgi:F-type H+-transporting ATPase subunit epsilon